MASRPILSSIVAVGLTATALHLANAPGPSSLQAAGDRAVTKQVGRPKHTTALEKISWSDQLDRDPAEAGKEDALREFSETLCQAAGSASSVCPVQPGSAGAQANVAFAIVPDPVHTHLALWFDRSIDSVEDALTDSGWRYDRYWIPWSTDPTSPASVKFKDRQQESLYLKGRQEYPGVILFRPPPKLPQTPQMSSGKPQAAGTNVTPASQSPGTQRAGEVDPEKPLVVFLIGDSPTSGINQTQFHQAVAEFKLLSPALKTLKIIGPNFTGSGPSLGALIDDARRHDLPDVQVQVASGSVSDSRCGNLLIGGEVRSVNGASQCDDSSLHKDGSSPADTFASFDADLVWQVGQTVEYLTRNGGMKPSEVAQLNEDESSFGELSRTRDKSQSQDRSGGRAATPFKNQREAKHTDGPQVQGPAPYPMGERILTLTYPRNISHLRSAYQKNGVWGFGGTATGASSISLSLDFDEPPEADDSIPSFAKGQLPVSQEAALGQVSALLEQCHIKAVIISATDVLDTLFVAQIIARQNPTIAIIIRGTDDLFLRSGDGGVYHNMYAISPWPLIPKNGLWSQPAPSSGTDLNVRVFPSSEIEGVYAATRFLLPGAENLTRLQDYVSPIVPAPAVVGSGGTQSAADRQPPLWLLAVGHGAYWPFALLSSDGQGAAELKPRSRSPFNLPVIPGLDQPSGLNLANERLPLTAQFAILLAFLLCLLHACKCFDVAVLRRFALRYRVMEDSVRLPKLWLRIGLSAVGACILALLTHPVEHWQPEHYLCLLGGLALSAAIVRSSLDLAGRRVAGHALLGTPALIVATLLLTAVGVAFWQWVWYFLPPEASAASGIQSFFLYRSHFALSGVSPIFPLLLALIGIAFYLLAQMDRFTFGECLAPRLPDNLADFTNCPTQQSLKPLTGLISCPTPYAFVRKKFGLLFSVTALCAVAGAMGHLAPMTFDGWRLRVCADAVLFLLLVTLLWDLTMAHYLWRQLKELCLEPLEHSSLRRGFNLVGGMTWQDLWIMPQSHTSLSQYRSLLRSLEQTERNGLGEIAGLDWLRLKTREMWTAERQDSTEVAERFSYVQLLVARLARVVLYKLRPVWAAEQRLITAPDRHPEKPDATESAAEGDAASPAEAGAESPAAVREEWISLIYVHFIRMVLTHIRSRLLTSAVLYVCLVWSITSYPYLNRHVLLVALSVIFCVLALIIVLTYASINRDPILNRTTNNKPDKLDFDFYLKTVPMLGLPLLGLIVSQFPEIGGFAFSWIEPSMAAVK